MNVHLVDGTFELFRAYYGNPSSTDLYGKEVGAALGLARSMFALLGERDVTHVAIAFDHVIESFRNHLYPGYKTGEGIDVRLYAQFGPAEDVCRALGIVTWPMIEFECDDALATAAERFAAAPSVERVVICSPDKDLAQCVQGDRVVCFDRMRRKRKGSPLRPDAWRGTHSRSRHRPASPTVQAQGLRPRGTNRR
jgi:5'-3' exonuclease